MYVLCDNHQKLRPTGRQKHVEVILIPVTSQNEIKLLAGVPKYFSIRKTFRSSNLI